MYMQYENTHRKEKKNIYIFESDLGALAMPGRERNAFCTIKKKGGGRGRGRGNKVIER